MKHMEMVRNCIDDFVIRLLTRGRLHDQSKLESPEVELFTEHTHKLADLEYGSPEYKESLKALGPALEHHYAKNRHHPEHWAHGVRDMDLVDLMEMYCDWKASSCRHHTGNLKKSIRINASKYDIPEMLISIFENTEERYG